MSEIDEELEDIFRSCSVDMGNYSNILDHRWDDMKQAILDLMCKHRRHLYPISFEIVDKPDGGAKLVFDKNPCKWCGKVQRGEG